MAERITDLPKTTRFRVREGLDDDPRPAVVTPTTMPSPRLSPPLDPGASVSGVEMRLNADIGRMLADRYQITSVIGEGGMGVVYEAWDTQVERRVAIKLMRADATADRKYVTRFRRELEVTSRLRHPSTIRVFEHGETEEGRPYMVMELLTGHSLAERLEEGRLDEMEALQVAHQVAESLSEAHEHGVFHRDLKPDNIFIETVGVSKVVKVLDFGIAGGIDAARLTQAGEVFGTPQYMSPEQCNGTSLDHRTDIYSLACILYEMLEGRPPFAAETPMATMLKHVRAKVPLPRNAHRETAKLVLMGLRKDRSKRIQTAGRFAQLIGQCIGHLRAVREGRVSDSDRGVPLAITGNNTPIPAGYSSGPIDIDTQFLQSDRRRHVMLTITGVLAAVGLGLGIYWTSSDATTPATELDSKSLAAQPSASAEPLPFNRALVRSNVKSADVLVDDLVQCQSPCEIKVPVGDGVTHEIRLRKEGFRDVVQKWRPKHVGEPLPPLPDMQAE